jgi:hypothetical protein
MADRSNTAIAPPDIEASRRALMQRVLRARTLPQIADARVALEEWLRNHPEDSGLAYGFDDLAMSEYMARQEEGVSRQAA